MQLISILALEPTDGRYGTPCEDRIGPMNCLEPVRFLAIWVDRGGRRVRHARCADCTRELAAKKNVALPEAAA